MIAFLAGLAVGLIAGMGVMLVVWCDTLKIVDEAVKRRNEA